MRPRTEAAVVTVGGKTPADAPRTTEAVARDLARARSLGARLVLLAGDGLARRADLPVLVGLARRLGFAVGLVAEGAELGRPELARLLASGAVDLVRVPLRAPRALEAELAGLAAALAGGSPRLRVEAVLEVSTRSIDRLADLVDDLAAMPRRAALGLRLAAPLAGPDAWPAAAELAAMVPEALARAAAVGPDVARCWEGFPPCLLPGLEPLRDERVRLEAASLGPAGERAPPLREAEGARLHPPPCWDCHLEERCPGAPSALLANEGEAVLRPVVGVRANSFNYELERTLPSFEPAPGSCPGAALGLDPVRSVLLVGDEGAALYRTPTSDFSNREIARVKDELEQLYVDDDPAASLDDFAARVRRARPVEACRLCPDRARCPGAWAVDPAPPFRREERWLRKEISRIRGRVLDVGCGEGPYRELLAGPIAEGLIDYHGLDPDGAALDRLRAHGGGGTLHLGELESFDWEPGWFDYVLMLRSVNHLKDVDGALRVAARLLRPGGLLVAADSPPFAMLRTAEQVARADRSAGAGHGHYRSWTSHRLVALAERHPFRVLLHRPVSAKTSAEWIVKLMRTAEAGPGPEDRCA